MGSEVTGFLVSSGDSWTDRQAKMKVILLLGFIALAAAGRRTTPSPSATKPARGDNNKAAQAICKGSCSDLKDSCGEMLGCGKHEFDVSKYCPATCAKASSPKDDNEAADRICKGSCADLKATSPTDDNEAADRICKGKC